MNRYFAYAALLIPTTLAGQSLDIPTTPDMPAGATDAAYAIINTWQEGSKEILQELNDFQADLPVCGSSQNLPESKDGRTVIVCDQALLFDPDQSRMVYVGNVRMRDPRLHLWASENLFIRLENNSKEKKEAPKKESTAASPAPATTPKVEKQTATKEEPKATTPAKATPQAQPATEPGEVHCQNAVVDTLNNHILLQSPANGAALVLTRGSDKLTVTPGSDKQAYVLADPQGNILIEGADIHLTATDPNNKSCELRAHGGLVYYHAQHHSLYIPGKCELKHTDGFLTCQDGLRLTLIPDNNADATAKKGFMHQFTGMRLAGMQSAVARGDVHVVNKGINNTPNSEAHGDILTYDGTTGACSVTGAESHLVYGNNTIKAAKGIHLLPNGDIHLFGDVISGTYERPADEDNAAPIPGTFRTASALIFNAEEGTITAENGFTAEDAHSYFSCTGPMVIRLQRKLDIAGTEAEGKSTTSKKSFITLPKMAISNFHDVDAFHAEGNVKAYHKEAGKTLGEMYGDSVDANLATGEATLVSAPGKDVKITYEGNSIIATSQNEAAKLKIFANGDLAFSGKQVLTSIMTDNGVNKMTCRDSLTLTRATHTLMTGSAVVMSSPQAIITTNAPMKAVLVEDSKKKATIGRYPQHSFNYTGIRTVNTSSGGTVRTTKGSMQCTGPISIVMDQKNAARKDMYGLRSAKAVGNVAIATKDGSGRLMHATGDVLTINGITGEKLLTGRRVTLGDSNNTHIVSGKGAAVRVDARNHARITGERHTTTATNLKQQTGKKRTPKKK